ncbi:hypothetical protein MGYG_02680 [Nannizzia gypsea CBS 118893]|uniref:Cytochrome P450 n=1 Tax=Arthroderma gypseum (strain ATCC MYA-4604 / CBS 118893) TaxID=535722 RepID=E4UNR4_ARTGP|nr:hypothetical protein MGYG_02680 [Nannizzia gypsea CBS 118893]EFQ99667.1 hypothetical protein MGYG_02680 [Nannizzia gypsea CBS 118893]
MAIPVLPSFSKLASTIDYRSWNWHWYHVVYLFLAWQVAQILWKFWWKAPSNVIIAAYPTPLGRFLTALHMVYASGTLLEKAYESSGGKPFAIPMLDRWIIFVSNTDTLKQLDREPEHVLSLQQALHELASTGPILGPHQVKIENKGTQSEVSRVVVGVLKNKLRSNIPLMSDTLRERVKSSMAMEMSPPTNEACEKNEWRPVRLMPVLLRIFTSVNLLPLVGEEQGVYTCWFTSTMLSFIGPIAMGWGVTRTKVYELLLWHTTKALEDKELGKEKQVVQFCIHRLCTHGEYTDRLRKEALECENLSFGSMNREMPYLDSFMKETSRLSPGPIVSAPRTVMVPYTMEDGCHIPAGHWIAIPQLALMRDEKIWPNGKEFEGFRFVDEQGDASESRFTHPSHEFPFWGSIKHACPARFYVSVVIKMVLSHLLLDYEFKLENPTMAPFLTFGKVRVPSPFMTLLVRKRSVASKV